MTHAPLRNALLNQMGGASVAAELDTLNALVNAQVRRARRLTMWTVIVWSLWFAQFALYLAVPMMSYSRSAAPRPAPPGTMSTLAQTQPADPRTAMPPGKEYGHPPSVLGAIAGSLLLLAFLGLPPLGIVLLVLTILSRRAASMGQVRASLTSIDAQLRVLTAQRTPPQE